MDHRFEKILIRLVPALILIPCIICVMLAERVSFLERRIQASASCEALGERESRLVELAWYDRYSFEYDSEEVSDSEAGGVQALGEVSDADAASGTEYVPGRFIPYADTDGNGQINYASDSEWDGIHRVYLTFDDGPSIYTDDILDILSEYGVKATFFCIGRDNPASYARYLRIIEEGHTLGMHSYTHIYNEIYASPESFAADTQRIRQLLEDVTGVTPKFYRFPGGSSNDVSATDMHILADYLDSQGIVYFDWNASSGDASGEALTSDQIMRNAVSGIEDRPVTVILMHDTAAKWNTVQALPGIIEAIQSMDNTVILPITDDTTVIQHNI